MSLEFNKIVAQVQKLGAMLDKLDFDLTDRLELALSRFYAATDLDAIHRRIGQVRQSTLSGYRGAAPLTELICDIFPAPLPPLSATIVAADGSQIYPEQLNPVHYFVINIGLFVYHHASDRLPDWNTTPQLYFHKDHVHEKNGRLVSNRTVDARRAVMEMQSLAQLAWDMKDEARPLVALYDNRLLFWAGSDVSDGDEILKQYHAALVHLHDADAILAGYIDSPRNSRLVVRLLYLLSLTDQELPFADLSTGGDLEGLTDVALFNQILEPGDRSAIMVQNSPKNLEYKRRRGESYEVAFFYLNVSNSYRSCIARVDIPMWVARDQRAVDELHALVLAQCAMQGRNPYPYALTRADELAFISGKDKLKLDEMIRLELRKKGIEPGVLSPKEWGKELARGSRRRHVM